MAGKIFVNYPRDDAPDGAARLRDGLVAKFGKSNVFMDVDNLLAGQRFDEELAKALAECDVLIAVNGMQVATVGEFRKAVEDSVWTRTAPHWGHALCSSPL